MNKQILKIFLCFCQLFVERVRNVLIQSSHLYFLLEPSVPSVSFCPPCSSSPSPQEPRPSFSLQSAQSTTLFSQRLFLSSQTYCTLWWLHLSCGTEAPDKQTAGSVFGSAPLSPSHKTVLLLSPFTKIPQSPKAMHPGSHSAKIQEAVKLVLLREFPWQRQRK